MVVTLSPVSMWLLLSLPVVFLLAMGFWYGRQLSKSMRQTDTEEQKDEHLKDGLPH